MTGHKPFIDYQTRFGTEFAARCHDCGWAQVLDEDLHEGREQQLLAWHVRHPGHGVNHLTGRGLDQALQIPP